MSEYGDVNTLVELNRRLEVSDTRANNARVHNPAGEVTDSLTDFLKARLARVEDDAAFADIVRAAIRQRLPEATFDQLLTLLHQTTADNNRTAEGLTPLFATESSGRTIVDHLNDSTAASTADQLYASTDSREILQAVTYLGSVMAKMANTPQDVAEIIKDDK